MKKMKLLLAVTCTFTLLLTSCDLINGGGGNTGSGDKCENCYDFNGQKPKQAISKKQALVLQREYLETRAKFLNEHLNSQGHIKGEDVRDVWYDIETIKQYIAYVEAAAKKKGYEGVGLRLYFGAYPKNYDRVKTPGYSTMFFAPTYKKKGAVMNFVYDHGGDHLMDDVDYLNVGMGGLPPKDLN
ncbi:hypothetical protein [uncultured Tenacibaculum sp.]|uniref:hypothetical protein n=1 Tax=uncultured Tenacibaculum sp. TaxID=174713 RepID=UPI00260F28A5|nr:hypothetical protein [uncultured Tenacibaculum sp.]